VSERRARDIRIGQEYGLAEVLASKVIRQVCRILCEIAEWHPEECVLNLAIHGSGE
jgi:hypothetical protein